MSSTSIWIIVALILVLIIILRSKPFRVWFRGKNKNALQKKAIKFLIYGPGRSKITKDDYDSLVNEMYSDQLLYEKACNKLGISEADLVIHPIDKIASRYLLIRNYFKGGERILVYDFDIDDFRSSRMDCIMVLFGKSKLYVYQISLRTDREMEYEQSFEYCYESINFFDVNMFAQKDDSSITASISVQIVGKDGDEGEIITKTFPSMCFCKEQYEKWKLIGLNLDSPELRELLAQKNEDEKKVIRYFKAYYHLPLSMTDAEYESMVERYLPQQKLKMAGMANIDIQEKDIKFAKPISFRSYIYSRNGRVYDIQGRDGSWRSSEPQHTWLFFGKNQIFVYTTSIGLDNSIKQESTQEIFYKDIASIKTEQKSLEKTIGQTNYIMSYYTFTIVFSGDNLTLTLPILNDENDGKIRAMRNLLRENKQQGTLQSANDEDIV